MSLPELQRHKDTVISQARRPVKEVGTVGKLSLDIDIDICRHIEILRIKHELNVYVIFLQITAHYEKI